MVRLAMASAICFNSAMIVIIKILCLPVKNYSRSASVLTTPAMLLPADCKADTSLCAGDRIRPAISPMSSSRDLM